MVVHFSFSTINILAVQPQTTAVEQFAHLREMAHSAHASGDHQAYLKAILNMVKLLNGAPDAVEASAEAYAENGETEQALAALDRFADLGQADDRALQRKNKIFAAMESLPWYQAILQRFRTNEAAVSQAEMAFSIPDARLLAEDIDYDPRSKSFLITSVLENKIVRITTSGESHDFATSPSHWPMLAVKVDAAHNLLWATEVALNGFTSVQKSDWGRSAVLCFDLKNGVLVSRIEGGKTALGDMVLTRQGVPIISDGGGGGVYEVKDHTLERIDGGDFVSPQTSAMHPDGKHVFVPDYARGIGLLDPESKRVTWLEEGHNARFAVNGIDGLYFAGESLIATQNGTFPERVILFGLNATLTGIASERIVERATPTLGDPTHGVIVGDFFYYIANSGWDKLDEHGDLKTGAILSPARLMRFRLPRPASANRLAH